MGKKHRGSEEEKRALALFTKLMRASDAVFARSSRQIKALGLSTGQFGGLEVLYHLGPLLQKELADKLFSTNGNVTQIVDKLEAKKLIKRVRRSDDRRKIDIHLTKKGENLVEKVFPPFAKKMVEIMAPLSAGEKQALGELLVQLGKANAAASLEKDEA